MNIFFIALIAVAVLLFTAVPGFLLIKKKMISEECIPGLSKILLFVCQPCLAIYTFSSTELSADKLVSMGIFAFLVIGVHALMLTVMFLIFKRKSHEVIYRIMTIGTTFGNCAFFGIPIIEALLPDIASEVIVYTTVYGTTMNIIGWTVGSAIISHDTRYIKLKKIFLNPATIGFAVAFTIFIFRIPIQADFYSMIELVGRMVSPLSMLIMGMRLATVKLSSMFNDVRIYITVAIKQFAMPLLAFTVLYFLPIGQDIKQTFFITTACPVASVVLNFAEIIGEGQKESANLVLFSTILSIVTLPIMMFLLPIL